MNKNTKELLRRYILKGIDWKAVTLKILASVVNKLNNRL